MARWDNSDRSSRLPPDWQQRRKRALQRDHDQCVWMEHTEAGRRERCPNRATEVDHKIPGDNHALENLQSLCWFHHDMKTRREGVFAKAEKRREINQRFRRGEEHPAYAHMRRRKD